MSRKERVKELDVLCKEVLRLEKILFSRKDVLDRKGKKEEMRGSLLTSIIDARIRLSILWGSLEPEVAQNWERRIGVLDEIYSDILQLDWLELTDGRSGNERRAHRKKK